MVGKIALEEHFAISETLGASAQYAPPGGWSVLERRLIDLDGERLARMDSSGIELAIVSLNAPGIQSMHDAGRAVACARAANDALSAAVARRPDRLAGFAALPMQDVDAAVAELHRSIGELGFKGVLVNGFSQTGDSDTVRYYDDPMFAPFWSALASLGVPFYLHPRDPLARHTPIYDSHPWLRGAAWAFGVETATHALRLMGSGLFDRHPSLTIVLGHLGEGLPSAIWRVDHRLRKTPNGIPARRSMTEYLRSHFYLTTSGNFRGTTLANAVSEVGVDRILFSVDYPFEDCEEAAAWFDSIEMPEADRVKIGRTNAARLFKLM